MSNCGKDFDRELIRDEILKMIQEGLLQPSVHDCNGNRIGQWAEVLVCGATGPAPVPIPGVDKDTKNKDMTWDPQTQDVSVVDTSNNSVSTKILFNTITPPPVNSDPAFTEYFGEGFENVLSKPPEWVSIKAADGKVYKVPVYFDDTVIVDKCIPTEFDPRNFHMRTKYVLSPMTGRIAEADAVPSSLDDKFTAYDIFTLVNQLSNNMVFDTNDYIYTTMGWIKYADIKDRDNGSVTTYGIIWEKNAAGQYDKSLEFPRYRLELDRTSGKAEVFVLEGVPAPCGTPYPEFKVILHGWYAAGNDWSMNTRYAKHEFTIPMEELVYQAGPDAYSGIINNMLSKVDSERLIFMERLKTLMEELVKELEVQTLVLNSNHGIDLIESPFGIMEKDPNAEYIYNIFHTTETTIEEEGFNGHWPIKAYRLNPGVDNGHRLTLASKWKWTEDNPGLYAM